MNNIKPEDLGEICEFAYLLRRRRGDAIMCEKSFGENGDECICTKSFNTGHGSLDAYYETEKMFDCKYKEGKV
ncbi:MAG: hypothetical protein L6266_03815 [Nanoarchaeota archaeon]|nr:hypothetical protein [Nanoarchaeota archaeon]